MTTYFKESVEFQQVIVTLDGQPHNDFDISLVPAGERPSAWVAATFLEGKPGVMISGLPVGDHWIYVRVHSNPETPVMLAGSVNIR